MYSYLLLVNIVSDSLQRKRIGFAIIGATACIIILNFMFLVLSLKTLIENVSAISMIYENSPLKVVDNKYSK